MAEHPPKDLMADFQKLRAETSGIHNTMKPFTDSVGTSMNYEILKELRAFRQEMEKQNEEKDRQMNKMKEELCEMTKKFDDLKRESENQMRELKEEMTKMSLRVAKIDLKLSQPPSIVDEIIGEWYSEKYQIYRKYEQKDDIIMESVRISDREYNDLLASKISISQALDDNHFKFEGAFFSFILFIQNGQLHRSILNIIKKLVVFTEIYERIQ